jgi:two-component sensor histidine kinase
MNSIVSAIRFFFTLTAYVVKTELAPFISPDNGRVPFEQLDIGIKQRAAIALGMTIHELATNAVEYGALSPETGNLPLRVESGTELLKAVWIESGGALPMAFIF